MGLQETEALILRTYNLAEADKIVVCLSRSAGLIRGVAKGCRKLRNRFGASLEPFTHVNLTYYEKENHELVSIRQTEILKSNFNLMSDPSTLTALSYMGDLLMEFSPPHQTNEVLFRMAAACFDAAAKSPSDLQSILRYFEVWLLKIEGFLPDLTRCSDCRRNFENDESVYMATTDFALCCKACGGAGVRVMSKALHAHLQTTQRLPPSKFGVEARNTPTQTKHELAELTHQIISRVLERLPRIRPTFTQEFQKS